MFSLQKAIAARDARRLTRCGAVVLLVVALAGAGTSYGRNYYLSGSGSDQARGTSPRAAWKSLARLAKATLRPGDTVFFRRGDAFPGSVNLRHSGTAAAPIVFTAYGEGAPPLLTGAVPVSGWKAAGPNRYEAAVAGRVYELFVNGRRFTPARYPNAGFLTIDQGFGKDSIRSAALTQPDGHWNGATLRLRTIDWAYETRTVGQYTRGLLVQARQERYEIEKSFGERTRQGRTGVYDFRKGYGFYLEGLPQMLDSAGEWHWERGRLRVQFPAGTDPQTARVEASLHPYGLWLAPGTRHVRIEHLQFEKYEKAAVGGGHGLVDVGVAHNVIRQVHGVGVLLDSAATDCFVRHNRLADVLGRGIAALEPVRLEVSHNDLRRVGLERGQGWSGVNGATAILIHNVERKKQTDTTYAHHNTVQWNRVDSVGYNGIRVDGHHNLVAYNLIEHCGLTLNDGANLYCYAQAPGVTHHSVFRRNIIRYGVGDNLATPANDILVFGIYLDNNSHDVRVEENTVTGISSSGMVNNDASFRNTFRKNTVFGCAAGLGFAEWANLGKIRDNVVEENVFVGTRPAQHAVSLRNFIGPTLEAGTFDRNTYVNLTTTTLFFYETKQVPQNGKLLLPLPQWQKLTGQDAGSRAISAATDWARTRTARLLVNDSDKDCEVPAEGLDLDGKPLPGTVHLEPFESRVVFQ